MVLNGCGRTDAGVHATQYYAYLALPEPVPDRYRFIVNKQLPPDIRLLSVHPVEAGTNARFDATGRTYDYFFHSFPDPTLGRFSSHLDLTGFDPAAAARLGDRLLRHTDFRAFCKTPDRHSTTTVHFREVTLYRDAAGDRFRVRFVANRFLRGMIRLLVNDLIDLGSGRISLAQLEKMLRTGVPNRRFALAPPEGLFLTGVRYPFLDREPVLPVTGRGEWLVVAPKA